jgi:hypothetical protein
MSRDMTSVADKRRGIHRTAAILAACALGLFLFTLYSGLK